MAAWLRLTYITLFTVAVSLCNVSAQVSVQTANIIRALQQLRVGTDTSKYFTSTTDTINVSSTHRQLPTARSIYLYGQTLLTPAPAASNYDTLRENNVTVTPRRAINFYDSDRISINLTDDGPNNETEVQLDLQQQGATTGEVLRWNGTQWTAAGINNYDLVTTSQTVSAALNQVFINTITANITLNLAPCNAANDGVKFEFVKMGTDNFSVIIDPSGVETFFDGGADKRLYSRATSITCTCRWSGSSGTWLYTMW